MSSFRKIGVVGIGLMGLESAPLRQMVAAGYLVGKAGRGRLRYATSCKKR
jgi:hypothetical protein